MSCEVARESCGRKKKPSIRKKKICDDYLRIWNLNFRIPGSKNDLQVFYALNIFAKMHLGQYYPPVQQSISLVSYCDSTTMW